MGLRLKHYDRISYLTLIYLHHLSDDSSGIVHVISCNLIINQTFLPNVLGVDKKALKASPAILYRAFLTLGPGQRQLMEY